MAPARSLTIVLPAYNEASRIGPALDELFSYLSAPGATTLPPEIEVTLLRVGQEALSNCRKHARASQVVMTLSYMKNLITLNVQDDGEGFDPEQLSTREPGPQSTGGFGLMGMRERVEKLRGTLMVQSAPGEGSTLMVAIPVSADRRPANDAEAVKATTVRGEAQ